MEDYGGSGVQGRIRPLLETWEARSKAAPASVLACSHARPKHSNSLVLRNGGMDYRACLMSGQVKISNVEKSSVVESKIHRQRHQRARASLGYISYARPRKVLGRVLGSSGNQTHFALLFKLFSNSVRLIRLQNKERSARLTSVALAYRAAIATQWRDASKPPPKLGVCL